MTRRAQLVQHAIGLQVRFYRLLRALGPDDPWLSLELTMPQLKVLLLLNAQGPSRVGALARALRVTLPTVTGVLDRLVEHGLVRRDDDPEDRRLVISRLTERGHEVVDELHEANRARLTRVFESLDPEDLATHIASLERVLVAAERLAADDRATTAGAAR
jgi:DNA-binding MarR family transcriptional regulator